MLKRDECHNGDFIVKFFKAINSYRKAVLKRDPAARNTLEVLLCYPGFWALFWHRLAHFMYKIHLKLIARIISQLSRWFSGIEIHPGAEIGNGCFIDHGMAVVIGETTIIGDDVTIYQGVTLGGTGKDEGKRHPTIGDRVIISSGAKVLGPFSVGHDTKVGAGSVVLEEIPPHCTVVGIPGRIVRRNDHAAEEMNQIDLPDPVEQELHDLKERIDELEDRLKVVLEQNKKSDEK